MWNVMHSWLWLWLCFTSRQHRWEALAETCLQNQSDSSKSDLSLLFSAGKKNLFLIGWKLSTSLAWGLWKSSVNLYSLSPPGSWSTLFSLCYWPQRIVQWASHMLGSNCIFQHWLTLLPARQGSSEWRNCLGAFQAIISWDTNQNLKKVAGGMNHSVELFEDHSSRLGLTQPSNLLVTMVRSHLSSKSSETPLKKISPCPVTIAKPFRLLRVLQGSRDSGRQPDNL